MGRAPSATKTSAAQEHAAEASQAGDLNLEFTSLTHPSSSTFVPPVRYRMPTHMLNLTCGFYFLPLAPFLPLSSLSAVSLAVLLLVGLAALALAKSSMGRPAMSRRTALDFLALRLLEFSSAEIPFLLMRR